MIFPAIVVFVICGAMLVFGGTLGGSDMVAGAGYLMWGAAGALLLLAIFGMVRNVWNDYQIRKYMRRW